MVSVEPKHSRDFRVIAKTQAEEDAYDFLKNRVNCKFTSLIGSIAHLVKGSLGGGILSGHVAYMKCGVALALPLNIIFGIYIGYCLHLLVSAAQILYKRSRIPVMSYADVGEASAMMFQNRKVQRWAKPFRYAIDAIISLDLFGSCCAYQIIIAKSIKQVVEDTHATQIEGSYPGYPNLRIYLLAMIPLIILICLIRYLKWLAPFSIVANIVILFCIALAVYYAFQYNPTFENMQKVTGAYGAFEFIGMSVFSMSCAGVVLPVENNMRHPHKFVIALITGMTITISCTLSVSLFGYTAFLDKSVTPITLNFPMEFWPKVLKGLIAMMIYVTHGLNFWVPFNLCFYYLKKRHPKEKEVQWELIYRALFVTAIGITAILFPDIDAIMAFLGTFCLSNMAFIWPNLIYLLVIWERPGLGHMKWRLWRSMVLIVIGVFIFICGSLVNIMELGKVFYNINIKPST